MLRILGSRMGDGGRTGGEHLFEAPIKLMATMEEVPDFNGQDGHTG